MRGLSQTMMWLVMTASLAAMNNGVAAQRKPPPPENPYGKPYDIKGLGLGSEATVIVAFAAERCPECRRAVPFLRRLLALPRMDGKVRRLIVVATDGVWPVKDLLDPLKFEPHRLTSGPYPVRSLPGVTRTPAVLLLDPAGRIVGKWEGELSRPQEAEIVKALDALASMKGKQP